MWWKFLFFCKIITMQRIKKRGSDCKVFVRVLMRDIKIKEWIAQLFHCFNYLFYIVCHSFIGSNSILMSLFLMVDDIVWLQSAGGWVCCRRRSYYSGPHTPFYPHTPTTPWILSRLVNLRQLIDSSNPLLIFVNTSHFRNTGIACNLGIFLQSVPQQPLH
jgi:hypothetical protein